MAKVELAAPPAGALAERLQVAPGRADWFDDGLTIIGLAPGSWLLIGPSDARTMSDRLAAMTPEWATFTDVTHGRFVFRLTSSDAVSILSRLSPLDFGLRGFEVGCARTCSVAGVRTTVVRDDLYESDLATMDRDVTEGEEGDDSIPSFVLVGDRSCARHLASALLDAGSDFDLEGPTG